MYIYLTIHATLLIATIVIYLSTFLLSYHIAGTLQDKSLVRFSNIVLFLGFMYYFYIINVNGMPGLVYQFTNHDNAIIFYYINFVIGAVFFLFNAIIKDTILTSKYYRIINLIGILAFVILVYSIVCIYERNLEYFRDSITERIIQIVTFIVLFIPEFIYFEKFKVSKDKTFIYLFICFSAMQFAVILINFKAFGFPLFSDILGAVSGIFLFIYIFNYYIKVPYNKLMGVQEELRKYAQSLDNIVDTRTNQIKEMNKKMLEDLEYAKDIQKAMIPRDLPQKSEFSVAAKYIAADKVSGDFYNVIQIDDENIVLYIGDVAGHGVSAAMLTVFVNQNIQPTAETEYGDVEIVTPSNVLKKLYSTFNKTNFKEEVYFVILYAIYNIKNHKLIYSSAGMNVQPIVMRRGGKFENLDIKGFPICKFIDYYVADYKDKIIVLEKGEKVFFYTDGLIEAIEEENEEFSEDLIKIKLMDGIGKSADEVSEYLNELLLSSSKLDNPKDDITWLILEAK